MYYDVQMIRTIIIIHYITIYDTGQWIFTRPPSKINYSLINAFFSRIWKERHDAALDAYARARIFMNRHSEQMDYARLVSRKMKTGR